MLQNNLTLTPNEVKVFQYVKEHPGKSKQDVWRGMKGDPSRVTVINILKKLEQYDMILLKKDKPNSQIYKIYANNNNLLVTVEQSLSEYRQSFFVLLDHLENKIEESHFKRTGEVEGRDIDILTDITEIHHAATHAYIPDGLRTNWSHQVQDNESLHRLYHIVFHTIMEIEYRFSAFLRYLELKRINYVYLERHKVYDTPRFPPSFSVVLYPVIPNYDRKIYKDWGLMKEVKDVLECIVKLIHLRNRGR